MTKAEEIYNSDLPNEEKYNKLLEMWYKGIEYSEIHTMSKPQEERFYEIPKYLSKLLTVIPKKKINELSVFCGF